MAGKKNPEGSECRRLSVASESFRSTSESTKTYVSAPQQFEPVVFAVLEPLALALVPVGDQVVLLEVLAET
jgi:hypothetical protein